MDYLESLNFRGSPTDPDNQVLAWPRYGVTFDGRTIARDVIPNRLKNAQAQLAIEQANGISIFASTNTGTGEAFVKREKVDVIETEFATPKETGATALDIASMPAVDALLRGLVKGLGPLFAYRG
jgi:hypothetical protein